MSKQNPKAAAKLTENLQSYLSNLSKISNTNDGTFINKNPYKQDGKTAIEHFAQASSKDRKIALKSFKKEMQNPDMFSGRLTDSFENSKDKDFTNLNALCKIYEGVGIKPDEKNIERLSESMKSNPYDKGKVKQYLELRFNNPSQYLRDKGFGNHEKLFTQMVGGPIYEPLSKRLNKDSGPPIYQTVEEMERKEIGAAPPIPSREGRPQLHPTQELRQTQSGAISAPPPIPSREGRPQLNPTPKPPSVKELAKRIEERMKSHAPGGSKKLSTFIAKAALHEQSLQRRSDETPIARRNRNLPRGR